jgi:uncharacterized protein YecE (DUF72 family)
LSAVRPSTQAGNRSIKKAGAVRIGISGWRYKGWRGIFYPKGLKQAAELQFASALFQSIEINGTHYSLQSPDSWRHWY